jgi:very-short-patch-repair endonuclease
MSIKYNKKLIPVAQNLRKEMTDCEKHLWYDFLSDYPIRFQRQKTIGHYIVDFYCHKAKLVVEVDGAQHFTTDGIKADDNRDDNLDYLGLKVLRIPNDLIKRDFMNVCKTISLLVNERMS